MVATWLAKSEHSRCTTRSTTLRTHPRCMSENHGPDQGHVYETSDGSSIADRHLEEAQD